MFFFFALLDYVCAYDVFACVHCVRIVSRKVDMRERNIAIDPQAAITKDNVSVEVSGNLYVQFADPEKV